MIRPTTNKPHNIAASWGCFDPRTRVLHGRCVNRSETDEDELTIG